MNREKRVESLIEESKDLLATAIQRHVLDEDREVAAKVVLFSGGNDSTVLAHLFREDVDAAAHCNTGIGIEATRQFVRDTCQSWGVPLVEVHPAEKDSYEQLVLDQGFPGPAHHFKMFQRLKERGLRQVRSQFVTDHRKERVVFLAGRRRDESARRAQIPEMERVGSIVYSSPLVSWTKLDLNTYRRMFDVPVNSVSDTLHMSGECLCGAFAHSGELAEIEFWFPKVVAHIRELEAKVAATGKFPPYRCRWGWGADKDAIRKAIADGVPAEEVAALVQPSKVGALCSSCDSRFDVDATDGARS